MGELTSSYDGWNFYSDGSMVGPAGQAFDYAGNALTNSASSFDWGSAFSGVGDFLGKAGSSYIDVWKQKTLMQQNIDGQRYLEGQRLQNQALAYQMQTGGIPPIVLLAAVGIGAVLLLKA